MERLKQVALAPPERGPGAAGSEQQRGVGKHWAELTELCHPEHPAL